MSLAMSFASVLAVSTLFVSVTAWAGSTAANGEVQAYDPSTGVYTRLEYQPIPAPQQKVRGGMFSLSGATNVTSYLEFPGAHSPVRFDKQPPTLILHVPSDKDLGIPVAIAMLKSEHGSRILPLVVVGGMSNAVRDLRVAEAVQLTEKRINKDEIEIVPNEPLRSGDYLIEYPVTFTSTDHGVFMFSVE
jgi:hypothetical protein